MDCFSQPLRLCIAAYVRKRTDAVDTRTAPEQPELTGAEQQTLEGWRHKHLSEDGTGGIVGLQDAGAPHQEMLESKLRFETMCHLSPWLPHKRPCVARYQTKYGAANHNGFFFSSPQ